MESKNLISLQYEDFNTVEKFSDILLERDNLLVSLQQILDNDPELKLKSEILIKEISALDAKNDEMWIKFLANKIELYLVNKSDTILSHEFDNLLRIAHERVVKLKNLKDLQFLCGYIFDDKCSLKVFPRETINLILENQNPLFDFKIFEACIKKRACPL